MSKKPRLVLKNSNLHRKGVFSKSPIAEGTSFIEFRGKHERWSSYKKEVDSDYACLMYTKSGYVIDPRINGNLTRFINHSCQPNCAAVLIGEKVYIETLRKVEAGEEITIDYWLSLGSRPTKKDLLRFPCVCGSSKCRGTLLKRSPANSKTDRTGAIKESI